MQTFQPSYDRTKGSFVAVYKKENDIQLQWQANLETALKDGFVSNSVAADLKTKFEEFVTDYSDAIKHFTDTGVTSESLSLIHISEPTRPY